MPQNLALLWQMPHEGFRANVCTGFKYTFLVLHTHTGIWREWGYLTGKNNLINCWEESLRLLEKVQDPKETPVMLCKEPSKKGDWGSWNYQVDVIAWKRAINSFPSWDLYSIQREFLLIPNTLQERNNGCWNRISKRKLADALLDKGNYLFLCQHSGKLSKDYMRLGTWKKMLGYY